MGDRVTTEVNSITIKVNEGHSNDVELIRNSNFEDGNKGNWTDDSTMIISGNTIPSELGQDGMKVLRSVRRDIYEDGILYSVKPNETFDVDYWVWPTGNYDSQLGLCFWDNAKKTIEWRGVIAKKGTGWTHYTGTIQAPAKAAFAKPWFQINKDGSESASAAWMAKPSIRRHDNFADQKISEVNTKLDVANGQIQGKVTETQVQDLLNKGHYATQEWSQGQINLTKDQFNVDIKKVTDDLNSRVNEVKTASEKFTSDGIEQTVRKITDVKNQVDGVQVGGRNILRNTDPKQIDKIESDSTWVLGSGGNGSARTISLPNTFSAKHGFEIYGNTVGNRDFTQRPIHWTKNRYIFSIYAKIADDSTVKSIDMLTRAYSNQTNRAVFENHYNLTSSSWERVVLPIDASSFYTQSGVSMAFGLAGQGSIDFAQPMLEVATKPSMWSPAPEDVSEGIKSAQDAAIKIASDQINLHVNELSTSFDDKLNKRVNEVKTASEKFTSDGIEQVVTKVTDVKNDVDRLGDTVNSFGGGINLVKETSELEVSGKSYAIKDYNFAEPLEPNTKYTISVEAKVDQTALNHKQFVFIDPYTNGWSWGVQMNCAAPAS